MYMMNLSSSISMGTPALGRASTGRGGGQGQVSWFESGDAGELTEGQGGKDLAHSTDLRKPLAVPACMNNEHSGCQMRRRGAEDQGRQWIREEN